MWYVSFITRVHVFFDKLDGSVFPSLLEGGSVEVSGVGWFCVFTWVCGCGIAICAGVSCGGGEISGGGRRWRCFLGLRLRLRVGSEF